MENSLDCSIPPDTALYKNLAIRGVKSLLENPATALNNETFLTVMYLTSFEMAVDSPELVIHMSGMKRLSELRSSLSTLCPKVREKMLQGQEQAV